MQPNPTLAMWGQIAAIILIIELFFFVLIALLLNGVLMFLSDWIRQKAELVKKLRPVVDSVNATTASASKGGAPLPGISENKVVQRMAQLPVQMRAVEKNVERGSSRVASTVIEFRARTVMVQRIVKAFFLPGLTPRQQKPLSDSERPGSSARLGEHASEEETRNEYLQAAAPQKDLQTIGSAQRKDASLH